MDLISAIKELTLGPNFFKSALREKRHIPRIVCSIKAYARIQNKPLLLRITDVGTRGLRVKSFIKFPPELLFQLTVETDTGTLSFGGFTNDTLTVKVAWCRKNRYGDGFIAGLLFADSEDNIKKSWVYYLFSEFGIEDEDTQKKRETIRIPVEIPVLCTSDAGRRTRGIIQDIGMGGVLIQGAEEIPEGESLELSIGPYKKFNKITVRGHVLRNRYLERSYQWLIGVQFTTMASKQYKSIGKMILDILKERKEKAKG
jgi:hypothetical protein